MEYKDFEDIEIGDYGEDYNGNSFIIDDYGTVAEMMEYDLTGTLEEDLDEGYIDLDDDAVAVKNLDSDKKYTFVYGSYGFRAYK